MGKVINPTNMIIDIIKVIVLTIIGFVIIKAILSLI